MKYQYEKMKERLAMFVVWHLLPRRVVMWAAVRVGAHATQWKWGNQEVPALLFMDALKRWDEPNEPPTHYGTSKRTLTQSLAKHFITFMSRTGMVQYAIAPIVDKLDVVPEAQRGWYEPGKEANTGKFVLNHDKVEFEDTGALKSALSKTRDEVKAEKAARKAEREELLKTYDGIDPVKTRALLAKFDGEDEAALIAAGKIDEVINRRMEKHTKAQQKLIDDATERENGALEVASTFMERVLDNHIRAAAAKAGLHASAIDDALLRARSIFSLNDDGEAVQLDDSEEVVLGKDGKTPFSPAEWLEGMKETAPHWFPAGASGGGAGGDGKGKGGSGKTMTRAVFEALDPFTKAATIKEKIAIVD